MIIENKISIEEIKSGLLESFPKFRTEETLDRKKMIESINNISSYEDAVSVLEQIIDNYIGDMCENSYTPNCDIRHGIGTIKNLYSNLRDIILMTNENSEIVYTELEKLRMGGYFTVGTEDHQGLNESRITVTLEYSADMTEETLIFHTWEDAKLLLPFSALRKQTKLSQAEFADKFHISKGTLTNWEQGVRTPPEYVPFMIETILRYEEALENIRSNILEEKHSVVKEHYSKEILRAKKNALNTALDIVEEEHGKL